MILRAFAQIHHRGSRFDAAHPPGGVAGRFRRVARLLLAACLLGGAVVPALAHPFHASSAQADFNRDTQRLEIAIRVFAEDLLDAVNATRQQPLRFEKSPPAELDAALHAYVSERFVISDASGADVPLRWVGREFDRSTERHHDVAQSLWLYVEAALPGGIEGARLHHALLQEHVRDQTNTVRVRDGAREVVLAFPPRSGPKPVRFGQ